MALIVQAFLIDSQLLGNAANTGGGAQIEGVSKAIFNRTLIAGNHANEFGGGIDSLDQSVVSLADSLVINNTVNNSGGGICTEDDAKLVLVRNVSISGNRADHGWGVSLLGAKTSTSPESSRPCTTT